MVGEALRIIFRRVGVREVAGAVGFRGRIVDHAGSGRNIGLPAHDNLVILAFDADVGDDQLRFGRRGISRHRSRRRGRSAVRVHRDGEVGGRLIDAVTHRDAHRVGAGLRRDPGNEARAGVDGHAARRGDQGVGEGITVRIGRVDVIEIQLVHRGRRSRIETEELRSVIVAGGDRGISGAADLDAHAHVGRGIAVGRAEADYIGTALSLDRNPREGAVRGIEIGARRKIQRAVGDRIAVGIGRGHAELQGLADVHIFITDGVPHRRAVAGTGADHDHIDGLIDGRVVIGHAELDGMIPRLILARHPVEGVEGAVKIGARRKADRVIVQEIVFRIGRVQADGQRLAGIHRAIADIVPHRRAVGAVVVAAAARTGTSAGRGSAGIRGIGGVAGRGIERIGIGIIAVHRGVIRRRATEKEALMIPHHAIEEIHRVRRRRREREKSSRHRRKKTNRNSFHHGHMIAGLFIFVKPPKMWPYGFINPMPCTIFTTLIPLALM